MHKVTPARARAGRRDLHDARRGFPGLRQPRLPSDRRAGGRRRQLAGRSTPAAGTSSAARPRSSTSPTCWAAIYRVRRKGAAATRRPARPEAGVGEADAGGVWRGCSTTAPGGAAAGRRDPGDASERRAMPCARCWQEDRRSRLAEARRNAVWAATRHRRLHARGAIGTALADADETVRQAAIHSVSLWRDRTLCRPARLLKSPSAAQPPRRRRGARPHRRQGRRAGPCSRRWENRRTAFWNIP